MLRVFALVVVIFVVVLGAPAELRAASENPLSKPGGEKVWHLEADEVTYDARQRLYTARGNVHLRSDTESISADEMRYDPLTHWAILEGNVRLEQGDDWLEGERASVDLETQAGTIEPGRGFLAKNHFYFNGARVEQTAPQVYHVKQGTFTTCDGENPSWHFRSSDLEVTVDGYGFADNARFYAGPVPLFYTPYLAFPAKTERQSGFLPPRLGYGQRLGWDIDLPFYWVISDSADATLYTHYMSQRGVMEGAEFRYAASEEGKGIFRFDYIHDLDPPDRSRQMELGGYTPGLLGFYQDRWWWRSKQDFTLPEGVTGKMDVDLVSDPYFLREFNSGFDGVGEANAMFQQNFGRGLLNDQTSTVRESTLQANKTWATQSVNADFHYYENLDKSEDNQTLQALPLVTYGLVQQPILGGPFFWQTDASYVDFYRESGVRGQRVDIQPRVALPLQWEPYVNFEPSVAVRETMYLLDQRGDSEQAGQDQGQVETRELYDFQVKTSTDVANVYAVDLGSWTRVRHILRPEVVYEYVPSVDQDELPFFDSLDRIPSIDRVTYSLTNFLSARTESGKGKVSYLDALRLKLSQSYSFDTPETLENGEIVKQNHRLSDIGLETDVTPGRYVSLTYKTQWSPYDANFTSHEVYATLSDSRGDSLSGTYRKREPLEQNTPVNEVDAGLTVQLTEGLTFFIRRDYSFILNQNIENDYRITLTRQCWGVRMDYVDKPEDKRFSVQFTLTGIGGLKLL
jgi:LPS-assembly protein